jgi:hypothetical protein
MISVLQETSTFNTLSIAYLNNCTPGSSLCCAIRNANPSITYTCSDNINGAWTLVDTQSDGAANHASATFKFDNNASSGKPVVTFVATGSTSPYPFIAEIGGTIGFDTHHAADNNQTGTGADAQTSGNTTPSVQPGLIWGVGFRVTGTGVLTSGSGFTDGNRSDTADPTQNRRYTNLAAVAATMTDSVGTDDVIMFGLWFKEASGAALQVPMQLQQPGPIGGPFNLGQFSPFRYSIDSPVVGPLNPVIGSLGFPIGVAGPGIGPSPRATFQTGLIGIGPPSSTGPTGPLTNYRRRIHRWNG